MGELSQAIGKKLERYSSSLFENLEWEILAENLQINCSRQAHKNVSSDNDKKTHGIDVLTGFYNPFSGRKEAAIIECKNHLWKDFIPSNISKWIEELTNTIECASSSSQVTPFLSDHILTSGILLFNSSDNLYDPQRATESLNKTEIPRKRNPIMIYLADTNRLDIWDAFNEQIEGIKKDHDNFGIIYPSIAGSKWDRTSIITPSYLFSDFILSAYTADRKAFNETRMVDVKAIFCFDKINTDSCLYIRNMINDLQLEARGERPQEIEVYVYPNDGNEIPFIREVFKKTLKDSCTNITLKFLKNRHISPVDMGGE